MTARRKRPLKHIFNKAGRGIRILPAVFADTVKDMRKPREIGLFATGVVVPGGLIAYAVYRVAQWRRKRAAANGNGSPSGAGVSRTFNDMSQPPVQKPAAPRTPVLMPPLRI